MAADRRHLVFCEVKSRILSGPPGELGPFAAEVCKGLEQALVVLVGPGPRGIQQERLSAAVARLEAEPLGDDGLDHRLQRPARVQLELGRN